MSESPEELTNQTLFSNQEPLLQIGDRSGELSSKEELTPEEVTAQRKRKKMTFLIGSAGVIFLILIVVLIQISPKRQAAQLTATPTPAPKSQVNRTEFQLRLDELGADLAKADPSLSDLAVPPVNMSLTIDPLPR